MQFNRWFVVCFLMFSISALLAQSYDFKVLVSKGKTEVRNGDAWASIKVGANLSASDEVILLRTPIWV